MMRVADPLSGCQLCQEGSGDAPVLPAVHVLNVRLDTQSRAAQVGRIAAVIAVRDFPLQQHGEPVVKAECSGVRNLLLVFHGFRHAQQDELQHALEIGLSRGHERALLRGRYNTPERRRSANIAAIRDRLSWRRFRRRSRHGLALQLTPHRGGAEPAAGEASASGSLDRFGVMLLGETDHAPHDRPAGGSPARPDSHGSTAALPARLPRPRE